MNLRFLMLTLVVTILASCSPRQQEPFKMVQFCLTNSAGADLLSREMRAAAISEGLKFIDNTMATRRGLAITAQTPAQKRDALWVVSFYAGDGDGMGVGAGNMGMSPFDVAVGFTYGSDAKAATAFADRLIARLAKHWRIIPVAPGAGAFPLKECSG
jgi:hypothetical protein